jgi:hypothetical protein
MEAMVLGGTLVYASFAVVFVVGVALGFVVIKLIGSS